MRTYKTARLLGGTSGEPKGYRNVCGKHSIPQSQPKAQARQCDFFVPLGAVIPNIIARLTVTSSSASISSSSSISRAA